jgi:hypothetical protein
MQTFYWTRADGAYGVVRAADIQDARGKRPNAKIHVKAPYAWMTDKGPRPASKKVPAKKTSRAAAPKAPAKKTSRAKAKPAAGQEARRARAQALLEEGLALGEAGDMHGAIALFKRSYAAYPEPTVLWSLGVAHRNAGLHKEAIDYLTELLRVEGPQMTPEKRAQVKSVIDFSAEVMGELAAKPRKTSRAPRTPPAKAEASETLSEQKAIAMTHKLLAEWGVAGYTVRFSSSRDDLVSWDPMTMAGQTLLYKSGAGRIQFSRRIWPKLRNDEKRDTVIHEVAHAVVFDRHGWDHEEHGPEWVAQMRAMGIPDPMATLNVSGRDMGGIGGAGHVTLTCCGTSFDRSIAIVWREGGADVKDCKCPDGTIDRRRFANGAQAKKYEKYLRGAGLWGLTPPRSPKSPRPRGRVASS